MISVIIPLFNGEKTIVAALDSVQDQTYGFENLEIIVVNDGSTDLSKHKTENYIDQNPKLNIKFISQENLGVSAARNAGLKIAKGKYIALLDADDVWYPEKTTRQLQIFENNIAIDFLSCRRKDHMLKYPYKVEKSNLAKITFRKLLFRNETQPSTVIFKRNILNKIGSFDDDQRYAEDHNFWLKVSQYFTMYILNEELVIAGGGKRSFGVSGLSADLQKMEDGFQKNLIDMLREKRISTVQYWMLYVFYKSKYVFRLYRNKFLRSKGL